MKRPVWLEACAIENCPDMQVALVHIVRSCSVTDSQKLHHVYLLNTCGAQSVKHWFVPSMSKVIRSRNIKGNVHRRGNSTRGCFSTRGKQNGENHTDGFFTFRAADTMSIPEQLNAIFLRDFFSQILDKYWVDSWKNAMSFITAILLKS